MIVPIEIGSILLDAASGAPHILIREAHGRRSLTIPISSYEANTIFMNSLESGPANPLIIDFITDLISRLGGAIERIVVGRHSSQGLRARVHISRNGDQTVCDCRVCDALALALRSRASLFAEDAVFATPDDPRQRKQLLQRSIANTDTVEFGLYYLE
ncbi:MAG: hypothetical protein GF398_11635 [Chitinivibrionales bacterium]|nr:hypothetical protein [Chitinivibrionales bacterium]